MGIQVIGEKKRLRAERETGLKIDRLVRIDNMLWEARVLTQDGHEHWLIDPLVWQAELDPDPFHWSSCLRIPGFDSETPCE